MRRRLRHLLHGFISPVAIGVYLTLFTITSTVPYYDFSSGTSLKSRHTSRVAELIYALHQKSIDYRLRVRGPRPVSPELALLTVDERAVAALGRWPWPRPVLARAIERMFSFKAKLIALDMVFSEPSENPAQQILRQMHLNKRHDWDHALASVAPKMDLDEPLARTFTQHADKLVAGAFFPSYRPESLRWPAETDFCRDLIFKRTPAAKLWDREQILLATIDPFQPYMPPGLLDIYKRILDERERSMRETLPPPKSLNEEILLRRQISSDLHETCNTILNDYRDEISGAWQSVIVAQENPREFKFATFDDWRAHFQASSKPSAIKYTDDWMLNTPAISAGTKHSAFFNTEQDRDGTIRRKNLIVRSGNTYLPSLALKAFLLANNQNASPELGWNSATLLKEVREFGLTDNDSGSATFSVPVDGQGRLLLNYAGPQKMFPHLSFADLLDDSPNATIEQRVLDPKTGRWTVESIQVSKADFIRDKIFIVGATAVGIFDLRVTPFEENYPGAETHLTVLDNMLQKNFFAAPAGERAYMALALAGIGFSLSAALAYLGAVAGLLLAGSTLLAILYIDQNYFFAHGMVVSVVWPLFLTGILYLVMTTYRYLTEERGKKELRQTFAKYVSPAIVNEILAHPDNVELGGRKVHLTVYFSDVRGFTTISEKLDPRALADLLNSYLTPMTELVFKNQGTLDKYMGDAIMAFFGAPISEPHHAIHACRCALQSVEKLKSLALEFERLGLPTIDVGIGLNTGEVSVGNMGSQTVRSYTVMGDAVNLASRLESINREYGTRIILSEMTFAEVKDTFLCREVDSVRVKGKVLPVKIYELLSEGEILTSEREEWLEFYREGLGLYQQREFHRALDAFTKALARDAHDNVAKLYLARCQNFLNEPPPLGWDGVYDMKTK